jgi:hypothetical protein
VVISVLARRVGDGRTAIGGEQMPDNIMIFQWILARSAFHKKRLYTMFGLERAWVAGQKTRVIHVPKTRRGILHIQQKVGEPLT